LAKRKLHIAKVGRVVKIALVSSKQPAPLRKEEKATILLSHLETRGQKSATEGFVRLRGSPKYVKGKEPVEHPKELANKLSLSSAMFIGIIIDFS